jgi:hypothetical protein
MIVKVLPVGDDRRLFQPSSATISDPRLARFSEGNRIAGGDMGAFGNFGPRSDEPLVGIATPAELLVTPFALQILVIDLPGDLAAIQQTVCTENLIRVADVMESPKLAE